MTSMQKRSCLLMIASLALILGSVAPARASMRAARGLVRMQLRTVRAPARLTPPRLRVEGQTNRAD